VAKGGAQSGYALTKV